MKRTAYRLSLYRRGRTWWVKGWDPQLRRACYMSLRETSASVARGLAGELEKRWNQGEAIFPAPQDKGGKTGGQGALAGLVEAYLAARRGMVAAQTLLNDGNRLERWSQAMPAQDPGRLRRAHLASWYAELAKHQSAATCNQYLFAVRSFLAWAAERGAVGADLAGGLKQRRVEQQPIEYLTAPQRDKVLAEADRTPYGAMVATALLAGLRLGELKGLTWADVDSRKRVILVRKAKAGRPRLVPLARQLATRLAAERKRRHGGPADNCFHSQDAVDGRGGGPVQGNLKEFCSRLSTAAGARFNWLIARHTFASLLAQRGVPLVKVAAWLGHSKFDVTLRHYATIAPGYDRDVEG